MVHWAETSCQPLSEVAAVIPATLPPAECTLSSTLFRKNTNYSPCIIQSPQAWIYIILLDSHHSPDPQSSLHFSKLYSCLKWNSSVI